MQPILTPNLPKKSVKAVLIDSRSNKSIIKAIEKQGIEAVLVPQCDDLSMPVSSHPDMLCHHLGEDKIIIYKKIIDVIGPKLVKLGFKVTQSDFELRQEYPYDCALNIARVSDKILYNPNIIDNTIKSYIEEKGIKKIIISQGYVKCSVCIVNENCIITADKGIAQVAVCNAIDVLLIRSGYIELPYYNYGFIGGTSGKISADKLCFAGNIKLHPDFDIINNFLLKHEVTAVSLTNEAVYDIGSIIPLIEE